MADAAIQKTKLINGFSTEFDSDNCNFRILKANNEVGPDEDTVVFQSDDQFV